MRLLAWSQKLCRVSILLKPMLYMVLPASIPDFLNFHSIAISDLIGLLTFFYMVSSRHDLGGVIKFHI